MKNITFTSRYDVQKEYYPRPSSQNLPEWYVKIQSYGGFGSQRDQGLFKKSVLRGSTDPNATIKKCVPVLDAMTAGYLLVTPSDIWVEMADGESDQTFSTRGFFKVSGHDYGQASGNPYVKSDKIIPKLNNPWGIKTPSGYSVLITAPMHSDNGYFTCLPAVVDTDTYTAEINFPFVLNDPNFTGLIPAGTPMVQVIPFKRDSWEMKIGSEKDLEDIKKTSDKHLTKIFNSYKTQFWSKKEFK